MASLSEIPPLLAQNKLCNECANAGNAGDFFFGVYRANPIRNFAGKLEFLVKKLEFFEKFLSACSIILEFWQNFLVVINIVFSTFS